MLQGHFQAMEEGSISKGGSSKGAEGVITRRIIGGTVFTFSFARMGKSFLSLLPSLRFDYPVYIHSRNEPSLPHD